MRTSNKVGRFISGGKDRAELWGRVRAGSHGATGRRSEVGPKVISKDLSMDYMRGAHEPRR